MNERVPFNGWPIQSCVLAAILWLAARPAASQAWPGDVQPPGRLVDLGGYRLHLWCTGVPQPGAPTIVLSIGGGGFAVDWSLVQRPLSDSARVCSYDRPGYGWSDAGPYPRTFRQEAFEIRTALDRAGERPPYLLVGQSLGAFVVRRIAENYRKDVHGVVLVAPTNENGKLGYRGKWVIPRTLATDRPIPPVRSFTESPPIPLPGAERDSCRARAERGARIWRPFDQLGAQAQRYRVWALQHPACVAFQDDYFAEEMAAFYSAWAANPHPLGDIPLVVVMGMQRGAPPPGLSEADLRSDSLRIDLSKLSSRGRLVTDSLSGHHVQLDNPAVVVKVVREVMRQRR
jgi:pimeloyl-ACP methyl ester carboxylesterase